MTTVPTGVNKVPPFKDIDVFPVFDSDDSNAVRDAPRNLAGRGLGGLTEVLEVSTASNVVDNYPNLIYFATGGGGFNLTLQDVYTPTAGQIAAKTWRHGWRIELNNNSTGVVTLVASGATSVESGAVASGSRAIWAYDAANDVWKRVISASGGGAASILQFNDTLDNDVGGDQTQWICALATAAQQVCFSGAFLDAGSGGGTLIGPYINGDTTQANYKCVTRSNNGATLSPATTNPPGVFGFVSNGYGHVWGEIHRFPSGIRLQSIITERDGLSNYVERQYSSFYETTIPGDLQSIGWVHSVANGLDQLSKFVAWSPELSI